jgi:hypothetical protein
MNVAAIVSIILCPRQLLGLMLPLIPHWHLDRKKMKTEKKMDEIGLVSQEKIRR